MVINNQTKIKLLSVRVVEAICDEESGKIKPGKFLCRQQPNEKMTAEQLNFLKSELAAKYNTPQHFVHCDFEIIEN
jgi:hypothetical protein